MVMRVAVLLLALLAGPGALAGDYRLWLTLPDRPESQVELGRPFNVLLWYQGPADLDNIVTAPWQDDFDIARGYAERLADDSQRLRLRLTPRRGGPLALAPLRLGSAQSQPTELSVGPAVEAGQALAPVWSVGPMRPWQREQIRVSLALDVSDAEARVNSDAFSPAGFSVQTLPPSREPLADGRTRHRFTWLLRATSAGESRLLLPRLRYIRDGVPRRRFHFPPVTLSVQGLPPYVTPTVPVGRIEADPTRPERLYGLGVEDDAFLAALERAGVPASTATALDHDVGSRSEARLHWRDAKPAAQGLVYFDVTQGKLRNLLPEPPRHGWRWLAVAMVLGVLAALAWRGTSIIAAWARWRYRRRLKRRLAGTTTAAAQARLLLARALPGRAQRPATLSHWVDDYQQVYGLGDDRRTALRRQMMRLECARFSGQAATGDAGEPLSKVL